MVKLRPGAGGEDSMTAAVDEISRLLGRMENELISLRRENEILFRKLAEADVKLDKVAKAADEFTSVTATVDRHEVIIQRGTGIVAVLAALATTLGFFAKDIISGVARKLGLS